MTLSFTTFLFKGATLGVHAIITVTEGNARGAVANIVHKTFVHVIVNMASFTYRRVR